LGRVVELQTVRGREGVKTGIEDIEDESAGWREVAGDGGEKAQLIVYARQLLHHAKGRDDQRVFCVEGKVADVALLQRNARLHNRGFGGEFLFAAREHLAGAVDTGDRAARPGNRQQNSTRAAAGLEYRATRRFRLFYIEADVAARRVQRHAVVQETEIGNVVVRSRCN